MSIRLRDIAEHLGISVSTVSLALRSAPQIAEETRSRVRDAAVELGYIHRPRQAFRTEINSIAFITTAEPGNVFYAAVLSGAESECRRRKISLYYTRLDESQHPLPLTRYAEADGLLLVGTIEAPVVERLKEAGRPIVLIDNNLPYIGLDRVLIENVSSTSRAVAYLAELGHRRIAHLCGPLSHPSFKERLLGYRLAMAERGLAPIELFSRSLELSEIIRTITSVNDPSGALGMTALVTCNDVAAIGALHALQDQGLRVPEDVALVGFDDIDMAAVLRPALTTTHVHREMLGSLGVQRLIERASNPQMPALSVAIETVLVERDSARPLRVRATEPAVVPR